MSNSISLKIVFVPIAEAEYSGNIVIVSDAISSPDSVAVSGIGYDAELEENTYELLTSDTRWDMLSKRWFGVFDYVQEIKDANPQISIKTKRAFYVPAGVKIIKPDIENLSTVANITIPEWRST